MISKRVISEIRALHQDKNRKEEQLFIAEGEKVVNELLQSPLNIKWIAGTENFDASGLAARPEIEFFTVSDAELLKISLLHSPNKALAVASIPVAKSVIFEKEQGLMLSLDGIKDPGNLGTLIRTADWFGVRHIFCSNDCVDAYNPKVVQSAMGSLFRMTIHYGKLSSVIEDAKKSGGYLVAGAAADGTPYHQFHSKKPVMLVIGSESHGISDEVLSLLDVKSGIPKAMNSRAESLNAGVAGAILMAYFQGAVK